MPNITTLFQGTDGATRAIFNEKLTDVNAHGNDGNAHVNTYIHTKADTTHNLANAELGKNISFLATADISDGDVWTVNGTSVTAVLQNGESLPGGLFKSGCWVTGVRLSDDGTQLFFKSAGGDKVTYNVFCQPTEPTTKTGIWLKTDTTINPKKIVFDDNIWAAGQWQNPSLIADMPSTRSRFAFGILDGKAYLMGGETDGVISNNTTIFDKELQVFTEGTVVPELVNSCAGDFVGRTFYLSGGLTSSSNAVALTKKYDVDNNAWSAGMDLLTARYSHVVHAVGEKLAVFGGNSSESTTLATAEIHDISTGTRKYTTNLPSPRHQMQTAVSDGLVYLFGGDITGSSLQSNAWSFDIVTETYTVLPVIPTARRGGTALAFDSTILICGGLTSSGIVPSVDKYDTITKTYVSNSPLPSVKYMAEGGIIGNEGFVFGGEQIPAPKAVIHLMLEAKQYPENPSVLMQVPKRDLPYQANILSTKMIEKLVVSFKNSMLFKDGDITFPALYIGNGTQWTLARAAQ